MFGPGHFAGADLLAAAADYLGMTEAAVREALRDGKSLADLAKDKGKAVDGLKRALRDEIRKAADRAVDDGVLTKRQADRLVEKFSNAVDELVEQSGDLGLEFGFPGKRFGPGPLGPLERGIFPGAFPGADLLETAADYLGMTEAAVREALRDGKSLADLAEDKGKSVDGLKRALRNAIREDADQAVEDGCPDGGPGRPPRREVREWGRQARRRQPRGRVRLRLPERRRQLRVPLPHRPREPEAAAGRAGDPVLRAGDPVAPDLRNPHQPAATKAAPASAMTPPTRRVTLNRSASTRRASTTVTIG
jgi:hypothetical protein